MTKREQIDEYISTSEDFILSGEISVNAALHNLEKKFDVVFNDEVKINHELERHATEIAAILSNWLELQDIE